MRIKSTKLNAQSLFTKGAITFLALSSLASLSACQNTTESVAKLGNTGGIGVVTSSTPLPVPTSTPRPTATPRATATPNATATPTPIPDPTSTTSDAMKRIYNQFISVFENSSLNLNYSYIENLNDGRGYTAGRSGFTSRDGDMLQVVELYLSMRPDSAFNTVIGRLRAVAQSTSGSTSGLSSLPSIWKAATSDSKFIEAQDAISDGNYFNPAAARAVKYNVNSPLGVLCLYDAAIEHGIDGVDGLDDMISRLPARSTFKTQEAWLSAFLEVRRETLLNPADSSTQGVWSASVGRVDTLKSVLDSGNLQLVTPISINPFGDQFIVK